MSIFYTSDEALEEISAEKDRIETARANRLDCKKIFWSDGQTKIVKLLTDKPAAVYYDHSFDKGKERYVCTDKKNGCPICKEKKLKSFPGQKGIIGVRWVDAPEYRDEPQDEVLFVWDMPRAALEALTVAYNKYKGRLTNREWEITRSGNSYIFLPSDDKIELEDWEEALLDDMPDLTKLIVAPTEEEYRALGIRPSRGDVDRRSKKSTPSKRSESRKKEDSLGETSFADEEEEDEPPKTRKSKREEEEVEEKEPDFSPPFDLDPEEEEESEVEEEKPKKAAPARRKASDYL